VKVPDWRTELRTDRSLRLIVSIYVVLVAFYALWLPSFEGPDETEHVRYVEACSIGESVHPFDPEQPNRWGYQIQHPALYYNLMGLYARVLNIEFPQKLVINESQNPRFPFIRHDLIGHSFPWSGPHLGLRLLRLTSAVFGLITLFATWTMLLLLFPSRRLLRSLLLAATMLMPNTLHMFAVVANDSLAMVLATLAGTCSIAVLKSDRDRPPSSRLCALGGLFLGLAFSVKITAVQLVMALATAFIVDGFKTGNWRWTGRALMLAAIPAALPVGAYFAASLHNYGSFIPSDFAEHLYPGMYRAEPMALSSLLLPFVRYFQDGFAADLGWQSVQLPRFVSAPLFWVGAIALAASVPNGKAAERQTAIRLLPVFVVIASAIVLLDHNRTATNFQIRHFWQVFPLAIPALGYATYLIRSPQLRRGLAVISVLLLVALNATTLLSFSDFYREAPDENVDRDYHTFIYSYNINRSRGESYLRYGTFAMYDFVNAFQAKDWSSVIDNANELEKRRIDSKKTNQMLAVAMGHTGDLYRALALLEPVIDSSPEVHLLYAELLVESQRREEAARFIDSVLPEHAGRLANRLRSLRRSLD